LNYRGNAIASAQIVLSRNRFSKTLQLAESLFLPLEDACVMHRFTLKIKKMSGSSTTSKVVVFLLTN